MLIPLKRFILRIFIFLLVSSAMVLCPLAEAAQISPDFLSEEEKSWLSDHSTLRVGVGVSFPPFMWVESKDGQPVFKGMVSDYVDLLAERLGVDMQVVFDIPFSEALARGRDGRIDLFPCLSDTPERSEFLLFTEPYLSYPLVIITREDAPIIGGIEDLRGKRFAVVKHLVVYSKMQNEYPNLDLNYIFTSQVEENLEAVSLGRADACIINLAAASYYIHQKGLTNLKIAAPANWTGVQLSMGMRKDWPILAGIIKKTMASIPQEEKDRISQRWIRIQYDPGVNIKRVLKWFLWSGLGVGFLFALFFVWNRRLKREIVEKENAKQAMKESERKLATLIDNLPGIAYRCVNDEKWTMLFLSAGCENLTGYKPSELIANRVVAYSDLIVEEDRQFVWDEVQIAVNANRPFTIEYRILDRNGKSKWVWEKGVILSNEEKGQLIIEGFINDISGLRQAENDREKLKHQLLQAHKMESIGTLAGGIAHDFNNILSSIIGFTELSFFEVEKGSRIENHLQEIFSAGKRARDLVKQILAFARQSGEAVKPIQVDSIIKEVLQFIRSSIPKTIEIRHRITSDSLIMGNPTQTHQILMNLCINAAQAMEETGGILEVRLKDIVIDNNANYSKPDLQSGSYLELRVSDTGTGIAPEIMESVFEPYFTTKGPGEGSGMGLAMVQGIVETYGGKITVTSTLGKGTDFSVYLPITGKHKDNRPYEPEILPTGTERILFIDDEVSLAKMASQILARLGYFVTTRTGSLEALELFRAKPDDFDLVISDMTMPDMTGDTLAVEMMKIRPDIPVIICTGYSKRISDEIAANIGIKAFTYKPMVKADLAKTVRVVLDEKRSEPSGEALRPIRDCS